MCHNFFHVREQIGADQKIIAIIVDEVIKEKPYKA